MKVVSKPNYEVDDALHSHLSAKYSSFIPDFAEFRLGPGKARVDKRITERLRLHTRQQVELTFKPLGVKLIKTCMKLRIPVTFSNVAVIVDEDIDTALHMEFEEDDGEDSWGYVFFPASQLNSPFALLAFVLVHEFSHCWLDIPEPAEPKEIYEYEFLVDVLSMAAFRQVVPPHTKRYREAVKAVSYVAAEEMKESLGAKLQREILRDPASFLKTMIKHQQPAQQTVG